MRKKIFISCAKIIQQHLSKKIKISGEIFIFLLKCSTIEKMRQAYQGTREYVAYQRHKKHQGYQKFQGCKGYQRYL